MYGVNLDMFHSHWHTEHLPNKFSVYTSANFQLKTEYQGNSAFRNQKNNPWLIFSLLVFFCSIHAWSDRRRSVCERYLMDRQYNPFNAIQKIRWNLSTSFLYNSFKEVLVDLTHSGLMPITVFKGNIFLFHLEYGFPTFLWNSASSDIGVPWDQENLLVTSLWPFVS